MLGIAYRRSARSYRLRCRVIKRICARRQLQTCRGRKLTVASDLATPPFSTWNDSGNDQGFTFELMGKIANKLGLELNYLPAQKFDNIIPMAKQAVKTDVSACNITINDARKKEVDFTDPYMDSNQASPSLRTRATPIPIRSMPLA